MDDFYDENLLKVHNDVKSFFKRNFHIDPNYKNGDYLDICVSIDGSYGHMGRNSKWGVSLVCESITGRLLDFEITKKCTNVLNVMILVIMENVNMENFMVALGQWKPTKLLFFSKEAHYGYFDTLNM